MAAAERAEHVETLTAMGFSADAARAALQKYHSLAGATNALLDGEQFEGVPERSERAAAPAAGGAGSSPAAGGAGSSSQASSQEPARVESAVFLGGPPSAPTLTLTLTLNPTPTPTLNPTPTQP